MATATPDRVESVRLRRDDADHRAQTATLVGVRPPVTWTIEAAQPVLIGADGHRYLVALDTGVVTPAGRLAAPQSDPETTGVMHHDVLRRVTVQGDGTVRWEDGRELDQLRLDPPVHQLQVIPGWQNGGPDTAVIRAGRAAFVVDVVAPGGDGACGG